MRTLSTTVLALLLQSCVWGQTINLRFNAAGDELPDAAGSVEAELDSGFTVFSMNVSSEGYYRSFINRFDNAGDVLWTKHLEIDSCNFYTGSFSGAQKLSNEEGYVLGTSQSCDGESVMCLVRYSIDADTLWTTKWSSDFGETEIGYMAIADEDYFLVAGVAENQFGLGTGVVAKTDSAGNSLWKQYYAGYPGSGCWTIINSLDSGIAQGYVFGGSTRACGSCDFQHYVLRVDAEGNELWNLIIPNQSDDANVKVLHYGNGNYYGFANWCLDEEADLECKPYLFKFDDEGDTLWTKTYGDAWTNYTYFSSGKKLSDNNLLASGHIVLDNVHHGFMMKLDTSGTALWQRIYYNLEGNSCRLLDIAELSTGELVAVGEAFPQAGPPLLGQDSWVIKTDSLGCLEPGCQFLNVEEFTIGMDHSMVVYPNPVQGTASVRFDLPAGFSVPDESYWVLFDAQGRELYRQVLSRSDILSGTVLLDLDHLAPGVYHLHWLRENIWIDSATVIKSAD